MIFRSILIGIGLSVTLHADDTQQPATANAKQDSMVVKCFEVPPDMFVRSLASEVLSYPKVGQVHESIKAHEKFPAHAQGVLPPNFLKDLGTDWDDKRDSLILYPSRSLIFVHTTADSMKVIETLIDKIVNIPPPPKFHFSLSLFQRDAGDRSVKKQLLDYVTVQSRSGESTGFGAMTRKRTFLESRFTFQQDSEGQVTMKLEALLDLANFKFDITKYEDSITLPQDKSYREVLGKTKDGKTEYILEIRYHKK